MKKAYEKPALVKKDRLSAVTAVVNGGSVIILPPPG
ncbi:MAG: putative RiPP precursor [Mesorhizobium sp.]|nr:MAG: putative RiPP precursor [Mesorhizobium sp.]TIW18587.1 MAG: putative RiPP precursor [Mesorhizobium sp.]